MSTPYDGPLVKWRSNPPSDRGTYDIITLCASTLIICAWSAVHVDVPRRRTWKSTTGARIFWFLIGIFMPELLLTFAVGQFRMAKMATSYAHDKLGFEKPQSFKERWKAWFASLWIQCITCFSWLASLLLCRRSEKTVKSQVLLTEHNSSPELPETEVASAPESGTRKHAWTLRHSFYALMGGFPRVNPDYLFGAWPSDELMKAADVSVELIDDKSKAGPISKAVLCVQIVFFCANCAARLNQRLPLSLLEITTIAHSLCALGAYAVWWHKPQDVGGEAPLRKEIGTLMYLNDTVLEHFNYSYMSDHSGFLALFLTATLISALYGCPHLLGLHVRFATSAEHILWLVSTIVIIYSPVFFTALVYIASLLRESSFYQGAVEKIANMCIPSLRFLSAVSMLILYPIASAFLVCESIRQIFALPEASFKQPQWALYVPHFS